MIFSGSSPRARARFAKAQSRSDWLMPLGLFAVRPTSTDPKRWYPLLARHSFKGLPMHSQQGCRFAQIQERLKSSLILYLWIVLTPLRHETLSPIPIATISLSDYLIVAFSQV
jgi:hypothetical protein